MGHLHYKGYVGSVEYSETDNCLFGKVLGLTKDAITYEGNNIDELKADFEGGVDDYLEHCERLGIKPSKAYNGSLSIRIPSETHCKIAQLADGLGISINAYIKKTLEQNMQHVF